MKKKNFFKFNLKAVKTKRETEIFNSVELYVLGKQLWSLTIGYMAYNNEKKDKFSQIKKSTKFCEINVSQPKKPKLFNKNK